MCPPRSFQGTRAPCDSQPTDVSSFLNSPDIPPSVAANEGHSLPSHSDAQNRAHRHLPPQVLRHGSQGALRMGWHLHGHEDPSQSRGQRLSIREEQGGAAGSAHASVRSPGLGGQHVHTWQAVLPCSNMIPSTVIFGVPLGATERSPLPDTPLSPAGEEWCGLGASSSQGKALPTVGGCQPGPPTPAGPPHSSLVPPLLPGPRRVRKGGPSRMRVFSIMPLFSICSFSHVRGTCYVPGTAVSRRPSKAHQGHSCHPH